MYRRLIINDLKSSKLSSATIFLFVILASFLTCLVFLSSYQLLTSIDQLMAQAQAPHFIQMHLGEVDMDRIQHFASNHPQVQSYQVQPFINVDSSDLSINSQDWTMDSQDIGFSIQNESFDFLLDLDNQIVKPEVGQVYVPISYYLSEHLSIGDQINILGLGLKVQGPIRDVQMNSSLSSSKRFLVHPQDLITIKEQGRSEYLIEFLLTDLDYLSSFQGDYAKAGLEANGPTITYPLIRLVNGLTEGIMLAILTLIALLTLLISFLCIRFTLLARLEQESQQVAVLRAIGLSIRRIKSLYLAKYFLITLLSGAIGYLLALVFSPIIVDRIHLFFGPNDHQETSYLLASLASVWVFFLVMLYLNHLLNRFKGRTPAEAMNGQLQDKNYRLAALHLTSPFVRTSQGYLTFVHLFSRLKLYSTLALILVITCFITLVPQQLAHSLNNRDFVQYMGIGDADILLSIQSDFSQSQLQELEARLDQDQRVDRYNRFAQASYPLKLNTEDTSKIWINHGDHQVFPLHYQEGRPPMNHDEIALSYLLATELNKQTGDPIQLLIDGKEIPLTVVGIYSDITNGGRTGQALAQSWQLPSLRNLLYISCKEDRDVTDLVQDLRQDFPYLQIIGVDDYRQEILGTTLNNLNKVAWIAFITAAILLLLIAILFNYLMVV
ncbi:FtsX-like permease family protein [Hutsoniella sourekii]